MFLLQGISKFTYTVYAVSDEQPKLDSKFYLGHWDTALEAWAWFSVISDSGDYAVVELFNYTELVLERRRDE